MQLSRLPCTWPFQALADETRFRVVRLLASIAVPLTAGQIAAALGCTPAQISRHLQLLESTGLLCVRRVGRFHLVCLRSDSVCDSLAAAVLSAPDHSGIHAKDLTRLLETPSPQLPPGGCSPQESADPLPEGVSTGS